MRRTLRFRAAVVLAASLSLGAQPDAPPLAPDVIVERALQRAEWANEQNLEARYTCLLLRRVETLSGEGEPRGARTRLYELVLVDQLPYYRLVEIDGEPPNTNERIRARKREEGFRREARSGKSRVPSADDDEAIRFDRELVSRYEARLVGSDMVGGRPAWLVHYKPKRAHPPGSGRLDSLLNRTRGRIWFDRDSYEVARLEFELERSVRFGWLLGSVSKVHGFLLRRPLGDVWLPREGELTIESRAFLTSTRTRHSATWSRYRPFTPPIVDPGPLPR